MWCLCVKLFELIDFSITKCSRFMQFTQTSAGPIALLVTEKSRGIEMQREGESVRLKTGLSIGVDSAERSESVRSTHEVVAVWQLWHHPHVILTVVLCTTTHTQHQRHRHRRYVMINVVYKRRRKSQIFWLRYHFARPLLQFSWLRDRWNNSSVLPQNKSERVTRSR